MKNLNLANPLSFTETEAPELRILKINADGELVLHQGQKTSVVVARPCFPWHDPGSMISLQNSKGEEVSFVEQMKDLAEDSQDALRRAISEQTFAFEVVDIRGIREEFELRFWQVVTQQGERSFQTSLSSWPVEAPDGRIFIKDVNKDLYVVSDPTKLSGTAEKLLWSFVD